MKPNMILQALERLTGEFPRKALLAAIAQREVITPYLLEALTDPLSLLEQLEEDEDYMLPLYAFYLLAQFREQRAYPLIVNFFSLPGDAPVDAFGDFVTESLGQVLASVSGGDMELMQRLVENPDVNEYTRTAALHGLVCLVANDLQPRDAVVAYFQSLFRGGLEREYSFVWDGLIGSCMDLGTEEVIEEIRQAVADDLTEFPEWEGYTEAEDKESALATLRKNRHAQLIEDTVAEMQGWACFKPEPAPKLAPQPAPISSSPKTGRNDPCPCGSGKKYKRCCGKTQA